MSGDVRGVEHQHFVLVCRQGGQAVENLRQPQAVLRAEAGVGRKQVRALTVRAAVQGEEDNDGFFRKVVQVFVPSVAQTELVGLVLEPELTRTPEEGRVGAGADFRQPLKALAPESVVCRACVGELAERRAKEAEQPVVLPRHDDGEDDED